MSPPLRVVIVFALVVCLSVGVVWVSAVRLPARTRTSVNGHTVQPADVLQPVPAHAPPHVLLASEHERTNQPGGAAAAVPATCTFGGVLGVCRPVGTCQGTTYSGLCPGSASSKCCIDQRGVSGSIGSGAATGTGSTGRPRITQTTLQRLSEKEHRAKWARFKSLHRKVYPTPAADAAAYAIFRANRVQIIYLNDRFGEGRAMFSSTSPLAATETAAYTARLGVRTQAPARQALLETEASIDEADRLKLDIPEHFQDDQWAAFSELASWAAANEEAIDHEEAFLEVEAVQPCTTWGNEVGLCRPIQAGACRTGKDVSVVSSICPFGSRCCIGDRDDGFVPAAPAPAPVPTPHPGPVAPTNQPASTARVSGKMEIDYRPFMQPITDQGECGSCWTFATMGTVEGVAARSGLKVPRGGLSRQWLLECDQEKQQQCRGGFPRYAMDWLKTHTPPASAAYPYTGMPVTCRQANGASGIRVKESGLAVECVRTLTDTSCNNSDQQGMLAALRKYGPLAVVVDASNWAFYAGGIYRGTACRNMFASGNHAVIVVGYGEEAGKKFWLIQNSFGPKWGEGGGYIRLEAHNGHACGVANQVVFATVTKA